MSLSSRIGGQDESASRLQGGCGCNLSKVTIINVKLLRQCVCERTRADNILKSALVVCVAVAGQGEAGYVRARAYVRESQCHSCCSSA